MNKYLYVWDGGVLAALVISGTVQQRVAIQLKIAFTAN